MKENSVLKRLLSVLLTVAMIVSLVAVVEPSGLAQAAEAVGVYSEDFESGAVLTTHAGSGSQENRLETKTNSYLQLTGLTATQLATPEISVEENTKYILSYRVKAANVSGNFYFYVSGQAWNDSNEYSSLEAVPGAIRTATDGWQTVQGTYTFSKNHVQFFFEEAWGGRADVCLDDITLTNTATGEIVYQESFDTTASLSVRWGNPTQTRAQEEQPEYYLQLTGASAYSVKTEGISIAANTEYVLSYRVKVDNVSGSAYFYTWRQEWDDSGNYSGVLAATEGITAATDGWQTVEVSFTSGKNHVQFVFEQAWNGSADVCLDDITLKAVGSETAAYYEDFTTQQALTVHSAGNGGSQAFVQDGNHYLALLNASGYSVKTDGISLEAGAEYALSYRVKMESVSDSVYFYIWRQEWDAEGNYSGLINTVDGITTATDGWQTVETTFTAEKNHVQFFFEQAWSGSADICLDDIQLTKAADESVEVEPTTMETSLTFNRVDAATWFLDAANVNEITGSYYFATVNVDGSEQKVVFEKMDAGFVIYEGFFTVYGGASVPQSSFEVPEGTVLYQFDPNVSWNDPISGGQQITVTQNLTVAAIGAGWYEKNGDTVPEYFVDQWNVTLGDNLDVNFYIHIDHALAETGYVRITVGTGAPIDCKISDANKAESGAYIFTAQIAAAQMADTIALQIVNGEQLGDIMTYSVEQYAEAILADETQSVYHAIVKEMLNYGARAQNYFDHNIDNIVGTNADLSGTGSSDISEAEVEDMVVSGEVDGAAFYGASLLFRSKNAVRFYFTGSCEGVTVTVNGEPATATAMSEDRWYIEVADINPQELDQTFTVVVNGELSVTYSPMNYIARMSVKGSDNLKALLKALYNYHLAAKALAA